MKHIKVGIKHQLNITMQTFSMCFIYYGTFEKN